MINYLIAFPAEIQAMQLLEPYGYAYILPRPAGQGWDDYAWNQSSAMIGGTKIIKSYSNGVPVYDTQWFWVSLLNPDPHQDMWARFSGQPCIELDFSRPPGNPVKPSDYVSRSVHLAWDINTLKGITPGWLGMPDMGFPYNSAG